MSMMLLKAKQHHSKREKGRNCCRWTSLLLSRGASTGTYIIREIVRVFVVDLNSLHGICSSRRSEQDLFYRHQRPLLRRRFSIISQSSRTIVQQHLYIEKIREKNHFPFLLLRPSPISCPFIENLFTNWGRVKSVGSLFLCLHSSFNAFHLRLLLLFSA